MSDPVTRNAAGKRNGPSVHRTDSDRRGLIEAFAQLGKGPASGAMGNVMSGIAEALVATGIGLLVALPAVVAYNIAQKRIGEIESNAVSLAKLLTAWLKTRDRQHQLLEKIETHESYTLYVDDDFTSPHAVPLNGEKRSQLTKQNGGTSWPE